MKVKWVPLSNGVSSTLAAGSNSGEPTADWRVSVNWNLRSYTPADYATYMLAPVGQQVTIGFTAYREVGDGLSSINAACTADDDVRGALIITAPDGATTVLSPAVLSAGAAKPLIKGFQTQSYTVTAVGNASLEAVPDLCVLLTDGSGNLLSASNNLFYIN